MDHVSERGATLKRALILTCLILAVEFAGGLVSHSLALLSDAGHVLTDVFALGLAWFAVEQAKRPADKRRSKRRPTPRIVVEVAALGEWVARNYGTR